MTKRIMNYQEVVAVGENLKQVCARDDKGFAKYIPGWDDAGVAEIHKVTELNVRNLRETLIGKLPPTPKRNDLEARIAALEAWAAARPKCPFTP